MRQKLVRDVCRRAPWRKHAQQTALYLVVLGVVLSSCFVCATAQVEVNYTINISKIDDTLELPLLPQSSDNGKLVIKLEFVNPGGKGKWEAAFPNKPDVIEIRYQEGNKDIPYSGQPFPFGKNLPLKISVANIVQNGVNLDYHISRADTNETKKGKLVFLLPVKAGNTEAKTQPAAAQSLKDENTRLENDRRSASRLVYVAAFTLLIGFTGWLTINLVAWRRLKGVEQLKGIEPPKDIEPLKGIEPPKGIKKDELTEIISNALEEKLKSPPAELLDQVKKQFTDSSIFTDALENPPQNFISKIKEASSQKPNYDERAQRFFDELDKRGLMLTSQTTQEIIEKSIERLKVHRSGSDDDPAGLVAFDTKAVNSDMGLLKNELKAIRRITQEVIQYLQNQQKGLSGGGATENLSTTAVQPPESVPVKIVEDLVAVEVIPQVSNQDLMPLIEEEKRKVSERIADLADYVDALRTVNSKSVSTCEGYLTRGKDEYELYLQSLDKVSDEQQLRNVSQSNLDWFNKNFVKYILEQSCEELKRDGNSELDMSFKRLINALELSFSWPMERHSFKENQQADVSESHPVEYENAYYQVIKEVLSPCVYKDDQNILVKARVKTA